MKSGYKLLIISSILLLNGCCILFNNNYRKRVGFLSRYEDDTVRIYNNSEFVCELKLPAVYEVKAGDWPWRSKYEFAFFRNGEYIGSQKLNAKVSLWYIANGPFVILGGIGFVGLVLDPITLDMWRINPPMSYNIEDEDFESNITE